ncbi:hypothetical protein B0H11DRAFT_453818 [Mycena galericulata]|nr:hypothetical protein B0H11DRAFT_453818 [Mycena galericulata]
MSSSIATFVSSSLAHKTHAPPLLTLFISGLHVASFVASKLKAPNIGPVASSTISSIMDPSKTVLESFDTYKSSSLVFASTLTVLGIMLGVFTVMNRSLNASSSFGGGLNNEHDNSDGDDPPGPDDGSDDSNTGTRHDSDTNGTGNTTNGEEPPPPPPPAVDCDACRKRRRDYWLFLILCIIITVLACYFAPQICAFLLSKPVRSFAWTSLKLCLDLVPANILTDIVLAVDWLSSPPVWFKVAGIVGSTYLSFWSLHWVARILAAGYRLSRWISAQLHRAFGYLPRLLLAVCSFLLELVLFLICLAVAFYVAMAVLALTVEWFAFMFPTVAELRQVGNWGLRGFLLAVYIYRSKPRRQVV